MEYNAATGAPLMGALKKFVTKILMGDKSLCPIRIMIHMCGVYCGYSVYCDVFAQGSGARLSDCRIHCLLLFDSPAAACELELSGNLLSRGLLTLMK